MPPSCLLTFLLLAAEVAALALSPGRHAAMARTHARAVPHMQALQDRPPTDMQKQLNDVRAQMEADEKTSAMMAALRGSNLNDDESAAAGTTMRVVEMRRGEGDDTLPLVYDPERLAAYFGKRPLAVVTRVAQVASASGGWIFSVALDALGGKLQAGSEAEVAAVGRLRGVLVSLGPFFIKLGQALSIRPDILSPQAMVQLQQLCDKVPPFDSALAMTTIRDDLGCKEVSDVYSEITPEPVAAASLGQVYKATLRATGDEVAVKVCHRLAGLACLACLSSPLFLRPRPRVHTTRDHASVSGLDGERSAW